MTDVLIIDDLFSNPLIICPFQFEKCEHQFSYGDGAILICECKECYKTKKCIKYD